jgi:NADH-quinone oxidoreductase subunit N
MWLDPSAGRVDAPPPAATAISYAAAWFALPVVLIALIWIDPAARLAATSIIAS